MCELRDLIAENDRAIVDAVNRRLELVAKLKEHKLAQGYDLVDRSREDWLAEHLAGLNPGPLSEEGLRELVAKLLELTKKEVAITRGAQGTRASTS